jgi:hypothetical protein
MSDVAAAGMLCIVPSGLFFEKSLLGLLILLFLTLVAKES